MFRDESVSARLGKVAHVNFFLTLRCLMTKHVTLTLLLISAQECDVYYQEVADNPRCLSSALRASLITFK